MRRRNDHPDRLLADRDFRFFLGGRLISEIGSRITREGLPVTAVLTLGASAPALGLIAAAAQLPGLVLSSHAGALTDRLRRRPILIAGDIARGVLLLMVPLLALLHRLTLWHVLAITLAVYGITVVYQIADQAYFPCLARRDRLEEGNRLVYAAGAIGETAGPTAMGVLVQGLGAPLAIFFDAISYLASAVSLLLIRRPEPEPRQAEAEATVPQALDGLRVVLRHPLLRPLAFAGAGTGFFSGSFSSLYELYVLRTLHLSPLAQGLLVATGGVGALLGAGVARWASRRLGIGGALAASFLASALIDFLIPAARGGFLLAFLPLLLAQLLGDLGGTVYEIHEVVLRQAITPDVWLGRVNGAMQFLLGLLGLMGALAAGVLAAWLSVRTAFWVTAAGTLALALWLLRSPVRRAVLPDRPDEAAFSSS